LLNHKEKALVEKTVQREVEAMSKLNHPNVLRLFEVDWSTKYYDEAEDKMVDTQLIVLELAPAGELFKFLSMTGSFSETIARTFARQLVSGLKYMHSNGVYHRDLKPENLLMDASFKLKIADFGFAGIASSADMLMFSEVGTTAYMAPEIFNNQGYEPAAVDVWAAGVVLFIMVSGVPPFQKPNVTDWWFQKLHVGKNHLFWAAHSRTQAFSESFKDLINKVFCTAPARRYTLADIEKHAWVNEDVLSDAAIQVEFSRRKDIINETKAREKADARMQELASQGARREVEVGVDGKAYRGAEHVQQGVAVNPEADELPEAVPTLTAPVVFKAQQEQSTVPVLDIPAPVYVAGDNIISYTSFEANVSPAAALQRVGGLFKRLVCNFSTDNEKYQVTFRINILDKQISGTVQVYGITDPKSSFIVFRRVTVKEKMFVLLIKILMKGRCAAIPVLVLGNAVLNINTTVSH